MIVTTTENIQDYEIETLGIVFGNTVRPKHLGKDIPAGLKCIVGGELRGYSEMLTQHTLFDLAGTSNNSSLLSS